MLIAVGVAAMLPGCALGLDFDSLSNTCELPDFDIPGFDAFCSGHLEQRETVLPSAVASSNGRVDYIRVDTRDDLVAAAGLRQAADTENEGCIRVVPILSLLSVNESGELEDLGSMVGSDYGLVFHTSIEGRSCAIEDASAVWPAEVEIVESEPIHVLAAFGDGGLVSVFFDRLGAVTGFQQFGGHADTPIRRHCSAGACVADVGEHCESHADCSHDAYCSSAAECQTLDACTLDVQCSAADQQCATRRGSCTVTCATSEDCPHPFACTGGLCGGGGCSLEVACVDASRECLFGQCQPLCGEEGACSADLMCFEDISGADICAPGGTTGLCEGDEDCRLGIVTGFALVPPSPFTSSLPGLAVASASGPMRLAVLPAGAHPYFLPAGDNDPLQVWDVVYVEEHEALYASLPSLGILRIDIGAAARDGSHPAEDYFHTYPLSLNPAAPLTELIQVDSYLVTIEGALATIDLDSGLVAYSRILRANASPDEGIDDLATIDLGATIQPSVTQLSDQPGIWAWGVDRAEGGAVILYDMRELSGAGDSPIPRHLVSSGIIHVTESAERHWVRVMPDQLFVGSSAGVTPFGVEIGGSFSP